MAPSKLRKAIGAVKDQTSISLAKVGGSASLSELDVAIVKATMHHEYPAEERYIREILNITSYSRGLVSACVCTISRRLNKTRNWVVAIKSLMLIQRLLNEGDVSYEQEIFSATRRGTRLLNMSDFRDNSRSDSWDYSAFVRTYALYLDEQLEFRMRGKRTSSSSLSVSVYNNDDDVRIGHKALVTRTTTAATATPVRELRNDRIFSRVHHLGHLLDRFLACRPTGAAKNSRITTMALFPIVKESFQLYFDITETLGILIDRFMELDIPDSVKVFEIFCRVSKQYDELDMFYSWTKSMAIARSYEYPDVEKIPQKKLDVMDEFIREKSLMLQSRKNKMAEQQQKIEIDQDDNETIIEDDPNTIKSLPAPEDFTEEPPIEEEEKHDDEPEEEEVQEKPEKKQDVGDLLNLGDNAPTADEQADKFALALFDNNSSTTTAAQTSNTSAWEAFNDSGDWESTLVQSTSHLTSQQPSLAGGFDQLLLDGMYQQGATQQAIASSGVVATGSASSVALGSAGRPAMLALPAPPGAEGAQAAPGSDPFAASLPVAPPPYVQMSEIEKKQRLLVQEQQLWQQYEKDGRQGQIGLTNAQQNPYPHYAGNYTHTYYR